MAVDGSSGGLLASFVSQIKGVMFYSFYSCGACVGERVSLLRRPDNPYNSNCLDVRIVQGRYFLGHLNASISADAQLSRHRVRVSPLQYTVL